MRILTFWSERAGDGCIAYVCTGLCRLSLDQHHQRYSVGALSITRQLAAKFVADGALWTSFIKQPQQLSEQCTQLSSLGILSRPTNPYGHCHLVLTPSPQGWCRAVQG